MTENNSSNAASDFLGDEEEVEDPGAASRSPLPEALQRRRNVADAMVVIDRSGTSDLLEKATTARSDNGKRMGRPRELSIWALLVVLLTLALERRDPTIVAAHNLILNLESDQLGHLGLKRKPDGSVIPLHKVDHLWNLIADACNSSPFVEGKRLVVAPDGMRTSVFKAKCLDPKGLRAELAEEDAYTKPERELSSRGMSRAPDNETAEQRDARLALQVDKQVLLNRFLDDLLRATVPTDLPYQAAAVDWTDHETWANTYRHPRDESGAKVAVAGPTPNQDGETDEESTADAGDSTGAERDSQGRSGRSSADPDATWGRRRAKGASFPATRRGKKAKPKKEADPATPDGRNEPYFGHLFHAATLVPAVGAPELPPVVFAIRGTTASAMSQVAPSLREIADAILASDIPITELIVDMGYSLKSVEEVHLAMARKGLFLTFDYSVTMFGHHGTHMDAPLVGGEPVCPHMPEEGRLLRSPAYNAPREVWLEYHEKVRQFEGYRFPRRGAFTADLHQRYDCPALRDKAICKWVEDSLSLPSDADIPTIYDQETGKEPETRFKCCGSTITLRPSVGTRHRQLHPRHSKGWFLSFDRRTTVERSFAVLKGRYKLDEFQFLCLAKRMLFTGFANGAMNIERVRDWELKTGQSTGILAPREAWDPTYVGPAEEVA